MQKLTLGLALAGCVAASQSAALSCMRPDVAQSFRMAAASEDVYIVLLGQFNFAPLPSTQTDDINAPREVSGPATFTGQYLGAEGFQDAPMFDMTIAVTCAGPWCGGIAPSDDSYLAFVQQTADGYVLAVDPCGTSAFANPTPEQIATVESCMNGDPCEPSNAPLP